MSRVLQLLPTHWFAGLLLATGLLLGLLCLLHRQRRRVWPWSWLVTGAGFALTGLGGLLVPSAWGPWLVGAAATLFVAGFVVLLLSGYWSQVFGYVVGGTVALGVGAWCTDLAGEGLVEGVKVLGSIEFLQPWWLLLLLLIPLLILLSYRSLAGLGPVRRWVALGLRCAIVLLLTLALAEARIHRQSEHTTVLFLVDRSLSVPEEPYQQAGGNPGDGRWDRITKFINNAVSLHAAQHKEDKAGLIVFGRRPRLELPPSDVPKFNFTDVVGDIDRNYTDIGAAIKLALASFPEKTGKRIVLLSDGNENLGNAEEQARLAQQNGVEIDVVPLAAGQRQENEVLVQSIEAPPLVEQGSQLPIRVLVRSFNPNLVVGTMTVKQVSEGRATDVPGSPRKNVGLQPGLNSFSFRQPLTAEQRSYTYEAEFLPEAVQNAKGEWLKGLPGDRPQNNRATTHVVARGHRRILLVEPRTGDHQYLVDRLTASTVKFEVDTIPVERLPQDKDKLAVLLSNYDCVILANVAASEVAEGLVGDNNLGGSISEAQQEVLRSNTHDQGCGLIMIGGPNGFGAGGWRGTAVEKALPVDCDIKSVEIGGRGGLVLIMHASEIADGNRWQKIVAKLAIQKLSSSDMVGVLHYAWGGGAGGAGHQWHIPFQEVGQSRTRLLNLVETLAPGDMPDVDPALEKAFKELTNPKYELVTKHVIFISDGDHWNASNALLAKFRSNKITITTVCITSHGQLEEQKMAAMARATNGRFYSVKSSSALPSIYVQETRVISQSLLYERRFQPKEVFRAGPTEKLPDTLPPLYGFVRTTAKTSPLVEMPIVTPQITGQQFPVLAYWHYGLGKAAAFTSDARTLPGKKFWDRDWAESQMYAKYWEQLIDWTLRPVESKKLLMTTEFKDGKVKVIVDARDDNNKPIINLSLRGGVSTPDSKVDDARRMELRFEQKGPGQYEADFKAEEAGSYFVNAQAVHKVKVKDKDGNVKGEVEEGFDSVRSGVTIPYSPEFSDLESNTALLDRVRSLTGGRTYADNSEALEAATRDVFRPTAPRFFPLQPIWYWLLVVAGVLLFFDVAVRRIALDPLHAAVAAQQMWDRLRGRHVVAVRQPEFMERLRTRKAEIGESLQRDRAVRRFDAGDTPVTAPSGAEDLSSAPAAPARSMAAPRPTLAPQEASEEPADFASRLMKAKKRVWQERDKDKDKGKKD